jgi:plastocyanin
MSIQQRPLAWAVLGLLSIALIGVIALQAVPPPAPATAAPQPAAAASPASPTAPPAASAGSGGGASTTINATEKDFAIAIDQSSVPAGSVTFKISNQGPSPHNVGVTKQSDSSKSGITGPVIKDSDTIDQGKTTSITVDLQPGTYNVVCTVPGHVQLGMIVALTVK